MTYKEARTIILNHWRLTCREYQLYLKTPWAINEAGRKFYLKPQSIYEGDDLGSARSLHIDIRKYAEVIKRRGLC